MQQQRQIAPTGLTGRGRQPGAYCVDLDVRFELLDRIGSGSYATVYRARDKELGREVAVKQIHAQFLEDPKTLERYWTESQLLASLQHPNIVTIFDIVRDRGWLIMELMQGSLKERLAGRQMDLRSLRASVAHCLRALKYLHERGVLHGDIKPANMMIDHRKRVKLGDFGLARRVSDEEGSLLKGTAKYIAPEVVSDEFGEVGPHSDLYALGFAAYELMCGTENFENLFPGLSAFGRDKQAAWMMWHAAPDRKLPPISRVLEGVPSDLAQVIEKLVEKDPALRYETADEALSDLKVDLKIVKSGGEDEEDSLEQTPQEPEKNRRTLVYVALAISVVMSLAMLFLPGGEDPYEGPAQAVVGIVREMDVTAGQLEYEDPHTGRPALIDVPSSATILKLEFGEDDQFILPRDIEPGDWIEIENSADESGNTTLNLTVSKPVQSKGTIRQLDVAGKRVTIAVTSGAVRDDVSMQLPDASDVTLNGEPKGIRDLETGDDVTMVRHLLDPAGKLGHIISELDVRRREEFSAFVAAVDLDENRLDLVFGRGSSKTREIPFADDCQITLKTGEPLQKSDLREGDRLTVEADTAIHKIVVTREDLQIAGLVLSIDEAARRLLVTDQQGDKHLLDVAENADITLGLEPANLGDFRPEIDSVTVSYSEEPDGTLIAAAVDVHRGVLHNRWGLLISAQAFADRTLTRLPHANADAQLVYESLVNRYAMDPDWASRVFDQNREQTMEAVERQLSNVGVRHQLIVYLSGHAYIGPDDKAYFACTDFQFDDMPATGLSLDWLVEQIEACQADEKLLLLSVVHAGRGEDLQQQPSTPDLLYKLQTPITSIDVIGSCSENERGLDLPDDRHSAFGRFVAKGLAGAADADKNLEITTDELYEYLTTEFKSVSLPGGATQTPFRLGSSTTPDQ